jgi:hypothetical protein
VSKNLEQVVSKSFDRINASQIESTANTISGLILDEIGEDGHTVANKLWKIANYLRTRDQ